MAADGVALRGGVAHDGPAVAAGARGGAARVRGVRAEVTRDAPSVTRFLFAFDSLADGWICG